MSSERSNLMTAEGLAALQAELAELEGAGRERIAEQIRTARDYGDLKENAEYHHAKETQAHLETRIAILRERVLSAQVVESAGGDVVAFGSTVEVEDAGTGKRSTYLLVSSTEASPAEGRLSMESPVAVALLGRRAGEQAVAQLPRGPRELRILSVY
ncbi:MAG: transcription elongation factor GreA [Actinomycetota bacterium]|nr:transcription elongation factor GreA [Actinomycetota bacterium]